jgi:hypothetical protein
MVKRCKTINPLEDKGLTGGGAFVGQVGSVSWVYFKLNATPSPGESQPISQTPNRITDVPLGARLAHFKVHLWSLGLTDCRSKRHCLESGYHRAKDPTKKNHHLHSIWTIKRERPEFIFDNSKSVYYIP